MRSSAVFSLIVVVLIGNVALAQGSVSEQYLFRAANAERAQRGLSELRWDDALYKAAQMHAHEMAARQSISHQYPGEADLSERGHSAGARFSRIAENVAEAGTAQRIHDAWMHSEGHRENLLDAQVDSVAVAVLTRNGQMYAVEDFDRSVKDLTFDDQESAVGSLLGGVEVVIGTEEARSTCAMSTGYAGQRMPMFVMRFTAGDLSKLPDALRTKLATGKYHHAAVGACTLRTAQAFTTFNVAVMLYP